MELLNPFTTFIRARMRLVKLFTTFFKSQTDYMLSIIPAGGRPANSSRFIKSI